MAEDFASAPLEISLRDYVNLLRRRRAVIIQTFVVVLAVGVVVSMMAKPMYRAGARILVEGKTYSIGQYDAGNPLAGLFMQDTGHDILTQMEVLQGDKVVSDTYRDAGVVPGTVSFGVSRVGDTDVIDISAQSRFAENAERFAKTLPSTYRQYVMGNRKVELVSALQSARDRLKEESDKLAKAQIELQHMRERSRIFDVENERKGRIAEAGDAEVQLHKVEADLAGAEAQLAQVVAQRKTQPDILETPTETTNTAVEQLRSSIATLKTQRVSLLVLYKPQNTKVQEVDAQIKDLEARLADTPRTITTVTRTPNEAAAKLDTKINELRAQIASNKTAADHARARSARASAALLRFGVDETRQAQLEGEVERGKNHVMLLTKTEEDLNLRDKATHDPVLVIAPAGTASKIGAKTLNNLVFATLAGLVLGFCFALLQEYLDDRVNAPEDARRVLDAPTLGYVPLIDDNTKRLLVQPGSGGSILESYRVLRSNVRFAAVDMPTTSILVTSTIPGEGKSVTATNLAIAMALDGKRVILVDADLRRPMIHENFGLDQGPGVTNVLVGHTSLEDALKDVQIPGLRVLTSGPQPPNPAELLNTEAMRNLHRALKEQAEVVIIDSPPCLATADAQVLSAEVDGVLYVMQLGEVKKAAVRHAGLLLHQARANLLGVVFNKIDLSANRDDYYYGYYRYYNYYFSAQLDDGQTRRSRRTKEFDDLLPTRNGNELDLVGARNGARSEKED